MTDERFRSIMALIINITLFMLLAEATNLSFAIGAVLGICAAFVWLV